MRSTRAIVALTLVVVALLLQVTVFPSVSWQGIVPNLCLLVVVGCGLVRGPQFAMVLGFVAGALLDLAPPADHAAGRWALALVVVGYIAGRVRQDVRPPAAAVVATVAVCSFVGTSVFALTGILARDPLTTVPDLLTVIGVALVWDVLVTPFVLPLVMASLTRIEPEREQALVR